MHPAVRVAVVKLTRHGEASSPHPVPGRYITDPGAQPGSEGVARAVAWLLGLSARNRHFACKRARENFADAADEWAVRDCPRQLGPEPPPMDVHAWLIRHWTLQFIDATST